MFTSRTAPAMIDRMRLEAEYYDPAKLAALKWMERWTSRLTSLDTLCEYITDGTHVTPSYVETGIHFLSSTNIDPCSITFANTKFITQEAHVELGKAKCNPQAGDILLAKNGKIGTAAVYRSQHFPCSLFVSVALLRGVRRFDRDYVAVFLNSSAGWNQFARSSKTGVITNLHLEEIREAAVIDLAQEAQRYIGGKARQAELLRTKAGDIESQFTASLFERYPELTAREAGPKRCTRVPSTDLESRLIAGAYNPERVRIRKYLASKGGKEVRSIAALATPTSHTTHPTDPYIGLDCISPHTCFLTRTTIAEQDVSGSVRVLPEGPIISRLRPYLNKVAYVPSTYANSLGSTELLCVRPKDGVDGWFLYGVLKLAATVAQLNPISTGSTHPRVEREDILELMVPWVENHAAMAPLHRAQLYYFISDALVSAAKQLVEAVVDGGVDESTLSEAHLGLENRDATFDRNLLGRLTDKGIDRTDGRKLFNDLDILYDSLDEAGATFLEAT